MIETAIEKYSVHSMHAPKVITSDEQNKEYIAVLLALSRRGDITPDEQSMAELLVVLIKEYEEKRYTLRPVKPVEILTELMEANDLQQKDLVPMIGSESMVSMVMRGKRPLSNRHIKKLSKRFHLPPSVFFY